MPARVQLRGLAEFQARAARLENLDPAIRRNLEAHAVPVVPAIWSPSNVLSHARTRQDRAMLAGSSVRATRTTVRMRAATDPKVRGIWYAFEFGAGRRKWHTYQGRRGQARFSVTRRTQMQLPERDPKGRVLYRFGKEATRRVMALYTQTIVRTIHDALEGR